MRLLWLRLAAWWWRVAADASYWLSDRAYQVNTVACWQQGKAAWMRDAVRRQAERRQRDERE